MYKKNWHGWLKHLDFIVIDCACLHIAFLMAYMMRHGFQNPYATEIYYIMAIFSIAVNIGVIFFNASFSNVLKRGYYKEFIHTIVHTSIVEGICVVFLFTLKAGEQYSRYVLYMAWILYIMLTFFKKQYIILTSHFCDVKFSSLVLLLKKYLILARGISGRK